MSISTGITRTQMRAAPPTACPPRQAQSIAANKSGSKKRDRRSLGQRDVAHGIAEHARRDGGFIDADEAQQREDGPRDGAPGALLQRFGNSRRRGRRAPRDPQAAPAARTAG